MAGLIEMAFSTCTRDGPRNRIVHGGPDPPRGRGTFRGISCPLKSFGIACSHVYSDMYHSTVNDAQLVRRVSEQGDAA